MPLAVANAAGHPDQPQPLSNTDNRWVAVAGVHIVVQLASERFLWQPPPSRISDVRYIAWQSSNPDRNIPPRTPTVAWLTSGSAWGGPSS